MQIASAAQIVIKYLIKKMGFPLAQELRKFTATSKWMKMTAMYI